MQIATDFELWAGAWVFEMSKTDEDELRKLYKRVHDE
jgi:hypothetical protein